MRTLSKSEYIELQLASLTLIETFVYNTILFKPFMAIMERRYRNYCEYMKIKQDTEAARKRTWNKIINKESL